MISRIVRILKSETSREKVKERERVRRSKMDSKEKRVRTTAGGKSEREVETKRVNHSEK